MVGNGISEPSTLSSSKNYEKKKVSLDSLRWTLTARNPSFNSLVPLSVNSASYDLPLSRLSASAKGDAERHLKQLKSCFCPSLSSEMAETYRKINSSCWNSSNAPIFRTKRSRPMVQLKYKQQNTNDDQTFSQNYLCCPFNALVEGFGWHFPT